MAHLAVNHLSKSFGDTPVIEDISFDVPHGEFCILLGPSGCGKTTILRLIAGLEQQDRGEIFINSREVTHLTPRERDVAMVFQNYALYPHMNVYENMAFSLNVQKTGKVDIERTVRETAVLLGLERLLLRKPRELSGGQRQRVAIGRAIVRKPQLFLFDEPLSNLDARLRSSMRVELAKLHHQLKATTLYVTHDQVEAMTLGERIIIFNEGEIQQMGSPDELYHRPSNLFVASFIGTPRINLINGTINAKDNTFLFTAGDFTLRLGEREELRPFRGREITIGIRPESLRPGKGQTRGKVDLVEHLGSEALVYVRIDDAVLIAKAPPDFQADRGSTVSLALHDKGIHFFYGEQRIV